MGFLGGFSKVGFAEKLWPKFLFFSVMPSSYIKKQKMHYWLQSRENNNAFERFSCSTNPFKMKTKNI